MTEVPHRGESDKYARASMICLSFERGTIQLRQVAVESDTTHLRPVTVEPGASTARWASRTKGNPNAATRAKEVLSMRAGLPLHNVLGPEVSVSSLLGLRHS